MNRVYKVIWSKARHCYVVVSELTKSQHKSSSKSELISTNVHREGNFGKAAIAAIVAGLLTFGGLAYSPVLAENPIVHKDNNNNGIAIGEDSVPGRDAGKNDKDTAGYDARGKQHARSDKDYATWVSTDAAVSVGGADRKVTYDVLDEGGKPVIDEATGKTKQETKIVKSTRQITNLAAGTEATDAVNVAQMKVTATAAADAVKTHFYSVNSQDTKAGNYNNDGAKGKSAINAIAAGVGASSDGDSSIAVGTNSRVASNGYSLTSIAIGKNASVLNGTGQQEYEFGFDKDKWNKTPQGLFSYKYDPKDGQKDAALADIAGGIAIGTNSYARTGSIDIGGRTMDGRTMAGMVVNEAWVDPADGKTKVKNPATANIIDMTTVGTNSYNKGLMATIVGSYSINTGDFNGKGGLNSYYYGSQNMGSTIVGSLNQNRSLGKGGTSGVANSIIGVANVAEGANGALIFGAGNKVSNSIKSISGFDGNYGVNKVDDLVNSLSSAVKESESGGSTLVIGGGNTADYTQRTQIIGVNNTITGTSKKIADYNMVDGFNTTANNISHVYTIGYRNDFNNENNSVVIGDYHQMTNGKNNVVIGSYDGSYDKNTKKTTYLTNDKLEDAVILGHNANATVNDGVALGAESVASVDMGAVGYDLAKGDHSKDTTGVWKSKAAAVSVGQIVKNEQGQLDAEKTITRQITGVAAGTQDTDAVNVAQLKAVSSAINTDITASKTHFYSVNSTDSTAKNYKNDGATGINALAAGVGANAEADHSIAIGTGAWTNEGDGRVKGSGDIAIGHNATIHNYVNQSGSIALGQNALIENTFGSTEKNYAFNQTTFTPYGSGFLPAEANKEATGIAIGRNSFARTGSLMVGTHMYKGAIADMDEVDGTNSNTLLNRDFNNINMTTLGTNSFNNGTFATVTGAYSATTAKKKIQNFAATVDGSLNSIESYKYQDKDAADNSGVASSIVGTANRIANSNNTTILGAGNEVTNSLTGIEAPTEGGDSAKALQDTLKGKLQQDEKGAIVVSGIGNTVDSSHGVSVLGSRNAVKTTDNIQLLGDNREVTEANGAVIIGSAATESPLTTDKKNVTILGYNANATVEGSVALGADSVASREAGKAGYDPANGDHQNDTTGTWKSTAAAVSVGDASQNMTRQITNVAAGTSLTDAVNVAQLQSVASLPVHIYSGGKVSSGSYTAGKSVATPTISSLQFDFGDGLKAEEVGAEGDKRVLVSLDKDALKGDPDFKGDPGAKGDKGDKGDTGATGAQGVQGPKGEKGDTGAQGVQGLKGDKGDKGDTGAPGKDGKDGKDGGVGTVVGDDTNITVANTETDATKPANYKVSLNKAITVDKVTAGDTTISSNGVSIAGGPSMTKDGIDAGGSKITNVAAGTATTDAVNYGQLKDVESKVDSNTQNIYHMDNRISNLDNRINKVGAGAAALAALHPLDFNPDDKWDFAVGYGNYRNANSVALGAFYRPNEDTMFSLGTNFGNGENMFNAGLSFKIGQGGSGITTSKTAMAKKIESLENTVDQQDKKIAELEALVKEQGEMIRQYVGKK